MGTKTKSCRDCHQAAQHRALPSKEKHLSSLSCLSCHSTPRATSVRIEIETKRDWLLKSQTIDLDGNNRIDQTEWDNLRGLLQRNIKGKYSVYRRYQTDADAHGVTKNPQNCSICHSERSLFGQARLFFTGAARFEISVDASIFIPDLPSIDSYAKTTHGRKGVLCSSCHRSQAPIDDDVCIGCHKEVYSVYKDTVHAKKGATQCTDCHNPHRIEGYRELSAKQRMAVCSRCHQDYVQKHTWLPGTIRHFDHLECTTCHSPASTKSMIFFLVSGKGTSREPVTYEAFENVYGKKITIAPLLDRNGDGVVDSRELADFFTDVRKRLGDSVFVATSIVVTNVHHDFSSKRHREKICATCHSPQAPFYQSMFFVLPEDGYHGYVPVKGTVLSALPTSVFIDMSLLGEQKATWSDVQGFFSLKSGEFRKYAQELGFKWIDIVGMGLIFVTLFFVTIHSVTRIILKR